MYRLHNIYLKNIEVTQDLAIKISKFVSKPTFIGLSGELGSGKTTFARFLINSLANKKIKVLSPTFPIVQIYDLPKIKVWHFDLFRLNDKNELFNLDLEIALDECVIVEWPEIIEDFLPTERIEMFFYDDRNYQKNVKIQIFGDKFKKLKRIENEY